MLIVFVVLTATSVLAQDEPREKPETKLSSELLKEFKLRSIGPAFTSGRISDIAVDPVKPNTWYVAAGSGNLWKTTNSGTTWEPIFERYGSYSIGCVTIDPSNRQTIWVGSGEDVGGRHVGFGDGVYRSRDGGKSFENLGLKQTEHIARILVDPRDSDTVYVAAQGPLWSKGGERGLYKTTDGGQTWKQILAKGPYTGVTDVVFDPRNPDTLFAATHQRHRTVWSLINGGPETGIHKSTDGGQTWRELKSGLPSQDKGKIGLAISPIKPDVMYAAIELAGRTGGTWRSEDRGESWNKMSDYVAGGTGPHYYQEIWADPHRFDVIYHANVRLGRSEDGGKTWKSVEGRWKHVDNHAVAFHPTDPDLLLVGCDGGVYRSYDYGKSYAFSANLPLTQFYKLSVDNDSPFYHIVGGTQDNSTQYGPSRTRNSSGIRNSDWITTIGGDGHDCAIDPKDPNIIYCESQEGYLRRYDRRTGTAIDIRPQPDKGEEQFRFNWDSPIHISPHANTRLYFGSNFLHRSDDRGDSWTKVSPDLSRNLDRFELKVMDRVWSIDAVYDLDAMSQYGNITSISESPLLEGLIYVGTDDGLIQVTEDGGKTWRKIERIVDVPAYSFVNDIKADLHDVNTVYAALDNHKKGDYRPYLIKSTDRGRTWSSITGDLPDRHLVWRFEQDHVNKDLAFVGTEFGVFVTLDGGKHWLRLNTPVIPFRDLAIQRRENDLVGASFGRSFYVFDDYSPLRKISKAVSSDEAFTLFPIKKALRYIPSRVFGSEKGSQGDAFFTAPNPPFGAVFTYYLRDSLKTQKQLRNEKEAKVKPFEDTPIPGWEELTKEEREESPTLSFTIADEKGTIVNRITGPSSSGIHRIAWDLRQAPFTAGGRSGPLVPPGKYLVSVEKRVDDKLTLLCRPQPFEVISIGKPTLPVQNSKEVLKFQQTVGRLQRAVVGASGKLEETLDQLDQVQDVLKRTPNVDNSLVERARVIELQLLDLQVLLRGNRTKSKRSQTAQVSIMRRVRTALSGSSSTTYGPTTTHRRQYEIAQEEYATVRTQQKKLIEDDFAKLQLQLEEAGVPWTSGRSIP